MRHRPRRSALLLTLWLTLAAIACGKGTPPPGTSAGTAPGETGASEPNATLFYAAPDADLLAACPVFVEEQDSRQQALSALLKRYLAGPPCAGTTSPFPEGTELRAVYLLEDGTAVVDLSSRARSGGGTLSEEMRVYGLVDTVSFNHPAIEGVKILVEGQEVDSLLGHLDLSKPLPPDPSLLPPEARASWERVRSVR